jgi:hypothetical protein
MPRFLLYESVFPGGTIMTMYQRNRIKEEIDRQNAAADADADRLLDKLRASKWTAAILLASAVILIIILWSLL